MRNERGKFEKFDLLGIAFLPSSSVFPPLIRFRSASKLLREEEALYQGHRNSIGRIHNGVGLCAVRPLPLEFPRESCGDSFLPRDFLPLQSFRGVIFRLIARNRGGIRKLGKSFGKRDGGHFARAFVLLSSYNFLRAA